MTLASSRDTALSVLMLSPPPEVPGGVSAFAETLKAHLRQCRVSSFRVGSLQGGAETSLARMKRMLLAPFAVVRIVRRERIDVVHINPSFTLPSLIRDGLILFLLRITGFRRVLVYFHGWEPRLERLIQRTQILRRVLVWLLNGAACVTVLAPAFAQALATMGVRPERIALTRTLFDGGSIRAAGNPPAPPGRIILYLSRFEREKGIYELLDAFARIRKRFGDVTLAMAGDAGVESDRIKARAQALGLEKQVTFPGYVRGDAKAKLLKSCTVFALPTYFGEGMPIALLEAMGAGKPVLTARAGSIGHIVRDPENGVVLSHVTAESVEVGLARLLSDPAYCEEAGRRNEAYAWSRFEANAVAQEMEALYRRIAGI